MQSRQLGASFAVPPNWQSISRDDVDKARILLELLFVRLGKFRLSNFDVHSLIVALCTE